MRSKKRGKFSIVLAWLLLMQTSGMLAAEDGQKNHRALVDQFYLAPEAEARLSHAEMIEQLQKKVKFVFVIYQENRSFDSYFGTFPGANGLFSQPALATPGFVQTLVNTDGSVGT